MLIGARAAVQDPQLLPQDDPQLLPHEDPWLPQDEPWLPQEEPCEPLSGLLCPPLSPPWLP